MLRVKQAGFEEEWQPPAVPNSAEMPDEVLNHLFHGCELREVDRASLHELHERPNELGARDGAMVPHAHENAHDIEIRGMAFEHYDCDLRPRLRVNEGAA